MTRAAAFSFPVIVADIGGTNARFACLETADAALSAIITLPTSFSDNFANTIHEAVRLGGWLRPKSVVLAVAGAIQGHTSELNNSRTASGRLRIDGQALMAELDLVDGLLINDFEALSMALPELSDDDGTLLRDKPRRRGHMLVVGAGTGLGVGLLLDTPQGWMPVASQGGHLPLAIHNESTRAVLMAGGIAHWTGDEILSGRGLFGLYRGCSAVAGVHAQASQSDEIGGLFAAGDAIAQNTVAIFADLLNQFAASLAMITLPEGGVYIGGGLAPRFASAFTPPVTERAFQPGGEGARILADYRVSLVTAPNPAFRGLAALAKQPQAYALDYAARRWRTGSGRL